MVTKYCNLLEIMLKYTFSNLLLLQKKELKSAVFTAFSSQKLILKAFC